LTGILSFDSYELHERNEQIENLELSHHFTKNELQSLNQDHQKTKLMLINEKKVLTEKLTHSKDNLNQLRQAMSQLKEEYEKKEATLNKQLKEYKEALFQANVEKSTLNKEQKKMETKEYMLSMSKNEVSSGHSLGVGSQLLLWQQQK
jgi:chromosome segregation ATPase